MKKIVLLLFCLYILPQFAYANQISIDKNLYEYNDNYYLNIELNIPENSYIYSPNYTVYPTEFILYDTLKNSKTTMYYPVVAESYDELSKKKLELYTNTINYYILLDKNNLFDNLSNSYTTLSFLLCSSKNCTPYIERIDLSNLYSNILNAKQDDIFRMLENYNSINIENKSGIYEINSSNKTINISPTFNFIPREYSNAIHASNYLLALFFGLIAGLVLNFMPCVLPVIAIKFTSLLQAINVNDKENKVIKQYSLFYALGILSFFSILAFLVGYFDLIWGQIFQSTYFIIVLSGLLFMFSLSLFNVFYFPFFDIKISKPQKPRLEAYFQGILATLVATPCSGPLLGGVLAFSLTLPLHLLLTVFLATGLGMSIPYLGIYFFPNLVHCIPKSGTWTIILEKILAYIFLLLCLYLLSMLPNELLYKAIIYLFLVFFFISIYSYFSEKKHYIVYAIILFFIHSTCSFIVLSYENNSKNLWTNFTNEFFHEQITNEIILLNFTADWCPTCKVIENTSLNDKNLQKLIEKHNVKLIKVDMTNQNNEHKELLKSLNSISIPLLAIFPTGIQAYSPIILRDIFTYNDIENVLKEIK